MRTNWVLSEEEKRERLLKKRINAAKRAKDRQKMGKSNGIITYFIDMYLLSSGFEIFLFWITPT